MIRWVQHWRYRRLRRRLVVPKLLQEFAACYPEAVFVEVGSNDGERHDHVRPFIRQHRWRGLMVEPVPYIFERLRENYRDVPGVQLANVAVGPEDGTLPFFHLRDASAQERTGLPEWYDGIGSLSREPILSHAPQMPDIAERVVEIEVRVVRFATLLAEHGIERPDLLVIDAEGHDAEIVRSIDLDAHGPRLLIFEHFHLSRTDRDATCAHLHAAGYATLEEGFDTVALRRTGDALDAVFAASTPAVRGVAKEDESG